MSCRKPFPKALWATQSASRRGTAPSCTSWMSEPSTMGLIWRKPNSWGLPGESERFTANSISTGHEEAAQPTFSRNDEDLGQGADASLQDARHGHQADAGPRGPVVDGVVVGGVDRPDGRQACRASRPLPGLGRPSRPGHQVLHSCGVLAGSGPGPVKVRWAFSR